MAAIACRARRVGWRGWIAKSTFNLVWQHAAQFRQVARENPRLLKLLETFLWERALPLKDDPVAEMRDWFHDKGLADATWRYVHRHGSRLFRIPFLMSCDKSRLAACLGYLRVLEEAGLPPPPAPALARAWIRCRGERICFADDWCHVHRSVVRVILREGHARRSAGGFAAFVADAVGVLHWAIVMKLELNPQQARSGWHWLRRHWNAWVARQHRESAVSSCHWDSAMPVRTLGRFHVVPLTDGPALVEEAYEMRHCVDGYVSCCHTGTRRVFSVRCSETGRRIATLAISKNDGVWMKLQVTRFANRPGSRELEHLGVTVAECYAEAERVRREDAATELAEALKDLGALLANDDPAQG